MTEKKFLKYWLVISVVLFCGIMVLNYYVDPYLLYGSKRIEGFNKIKPQAGTHSSQSKIHLARKTDLDVLVVGNSRPEMGIDPEHAFFKQHDLKVFNLGQPGASLSTQYGYALDILREKKVKTLLLSVDFLDFLTPTTSASAPHDWPPEWTDADFRRKFTWDGSHNPDYLGQYSKDMLIPLIALGTVQDSIMTIFGQGDMASDLHNNGFNPAQDMLLATQQEGVQALFDQKIPMLVSNFSTGGRKIYSTGYQWSPNFTKFKHFLEYLRDNHIETKIFINPYHMTYLDVINHSGLTDDFSTWKIQLVKIVAQMKGRGNFVLWNFSDPSPYNSESFLAAKKTPLKWFWEPAHYRKELGDIMINIMFENQKYDQFGYILTPENVDGHNREYGKKLQEWQNMRPKEEAYISSYYPVPTETSGP